MPIKHDPPRRGGLTGLTSHADRETRKLLNLGLCPICAGRVALAGFTNSRDLCPDCDKKGIDVGSSR
jgi:hypothetical protein